MLSAGVTAEAEEHSNPHNECERRECGSYLGSM